MSLVVSEQEGQNSSTGHAFLFPCSLPSQSPGYFQGIPVLIWLVLLFFNDFYYLLCEVRTECSPFSTSLGESNLSFQGHLHFELMGTYFCGFWHMIIFLISLYPTETVLRNKEVSHRCFLLNEKDSLCDSY